MLTIIRQWLRDLLGFSKSEANGTLILILLILVIAILPRIYFARLPSSDSFHGNQELLKAWAKELQADLKVSNASTEAPPDESKREIKRFTFDPNNATLPELVSLGFSERAAGNVLRYRESGGSFRVKSDLNRIYGISRETLSEVWEYIDLPESMPRKEMAESESKVTPRAEIKLEINQATAQDLQKLKGIGPVLSDRIVRFRNRLGGFYSTEQLAEVYGLDPETLLRLKEAAFVSSEVKKIHVNADSAGHLYRHPYVDYHVANAIVNYRTQHGNFDSLAELKSIKIISDSLYQKIYPYLSLNP